MLIVYHNNKIILSLQKDGYEVAIPMHRNLIDGFEEIASKNPDELLVWCHTELKEFLNVDKLDSIFHHNGIMASYSFDKKRKIHKAIGYVDTTPFVKYSKDVTYPTWFMNLDVGGVNTTVITNFSKQRKGTNDFELYLNLMARKGMWQGLNCYSEPTLLTNSILIEKDINEYSYSAVFQFVNFHYKTQWLFFLFFLIAYYDRKLPLASFFKGLFFPKSNSSINCMEGIRVSSNKDLESTSLDVIIPTIGRKTYLYDVLRDFSKQTVLPKKIIIVEQNPLEDSISELNYIYNEEWPFPIKHIFIHQSGACNARNLALDEVSSEWVFLADDDNRFESDLIEKVFLNIKSHGANVLTTAYLQKGEKENFNYPLQWGTFGAGNSFVKRSCLEGVRFDLRLEFGYGEDGDFGMQLRNKGYDVIYFPKPSILHLKAPVGGFRTKPVLAWANEKIQPKPSPTVLLFQLKNLTSEQQRSEKVKLFINYYKHQPIKNPLRYVKAMNEQWKMSRKWALKLMQND